MGLATIGTALSARRPQSQHNYVADIEKQRQQETENQQQQQALNQRQMMNQAQYKLLQTETAGKSLDNLHKGVEISTEQATLLNALQSNMNRPGAELVGHFESNDDVGKFLHGVGPEAAKQHALDYAHNNIQVFPSPKGGFDVVRSPKTDGQLPIGPGHRIYDITNAQGADGNATLTLKDRGEASPDMTRDEYNTSLLNSLSAVQTFDKNKADIAEKKAQIGLTGSEIEKNNAEAHKLYMDAQSGGRPCFTPLTVKIQFSLRATMPYNAA